MKKMARNTLLSVALLCTMNGTTSAHHLGLKETGKNLLNIGALLGASHFVYQNSILKNLSKEGFKSVSPEALKSLLKADQCTKTLGLLSVGLIVAKDPVVKRVKEALTFLSHLKNTLHEKISGEKA